MTADLRHRPPAAWLLLAYVLFLAWVLLNPSARIANSVVAHTATALHDLGFSTTLVTGSRVEFGLNALMFAPAAFLAAVAWPKVGW